jgi:signal transduction histidine kinase
MVMTLSQQAVPRGKNFKILVIEDNPEDRELYKRLLNKRQDMNFEVFEAGNIKDGLDIGKAERPDCILLDYHLPDASGLDFIQDYRMSGNAGNTAIVMVTGQGSEETAAEAMKLGALDYITKTSIMEGFFIQNILNAVERARLREELAAHQLKLEKKNQELTEFAYTASHDLKAPLRRIASYCEFLKEESGAGLDANGRSYIDRMTVNIVRLQRLIDDLLSYSTASSAKEPVEAVDLNKTMAEVMEDLGTLIKTNNAKVAYGVLPEIKAGPVRIKQLFQNLVSNAIKYRGEKEPVIKIDWADRGGEYAFSVADNGSGIDEKFSASIFRPFQRLHAQSQIEGSGLGLAICRKVVHMHHGRIWVEPNPSGGSIFHFTISKTL